MISFCIFYHFQDAHFIRCIQTNGEKKNGEFNDELVLKQLKTSSVISHAKFIRYGYSKRIDLQKLAVVCAPIEEKVIKLCGSQSKFYSTVMLSLGLDRNEFKMGNDMIFIRSNKFDLVKGLLLAPLNEKANESTISISDPVSQQRFELE